VKTHFTLPDFGCLNQLYLAAKLMNQYIMITKSYTGKDSKGSLHFGTRMMWKRPHCT